MIKVLHLVTKMDRAGQETFLMNVYRKIDRAKIQFSFLCTDSEHGDYDEEIYSLGGKIFHLPENTKNQLIPHYLEKKRALVHWLTENRDEYDYVHLHTHHSVDVFIHLLSFREAKVNKVIIHSHNSCAPRKVLHAVVRLANNIFFRFKKLACSKDAGVWLFGKNAVKKGNVHVIPNGISMSEYTYNPAVVPPIKTNLQLDGKTVLGHIGRFTYQKNHDFLIRVFEKYHQENPNSVLLLVGIGELEDDIRLQVKNAGLTDCVQFLGIRNDIPTLLHAMDIFVFPSRYEGLGIVLIEAQCTHLPILAGDTIPDEAVISNNFVRLPIDTVQLWVEKIKELLGGNREDIQFLPSKEKFDINNVAEFLVNTIYI